MKNNANIEKRIEETLALADNVSPSEPPPFLYAKVMAKLEQNKPAVSQPFFIARPVLAYAAVICLLLLNFFVFILKSENDQPIVSDNSSNDEYSYSVTSIYDLENLKP
ncbi:MAG: hypothetical protein ABIT96_03455 [Ferruginibacter sp.]